MVEEGGRSANAKGLGAWLSRVAPRSARGEMTIAILPDSYVRRLNRRYRGYNRPTDVLSFPAQDAARGKGRGAKGKGQGAGVRGVFAPYHSRSTRYLGDVVIARGIARTQAARLGHPVRTELRVLALHGLLHLLGYDHEGDDGRMARVEARLRRRAGLPLGLIARSA